MRVGDEADFPLFSILHGHSRLVRGRDVWRCEKFRGVLSSARLASHVVGGVDGGKSRATHRRRKEDVRIRLRHDIIQIDRDSHPWMV